MANLTNNTTALFDFVATPKKVIVHGGLFHMDDVLTVVLLRIQFPEIEVIRNNKPVLTEAGPESGVLIADVGGVHDPDRWLFDHHQDRYNPGSDPETVRAAVGRIWDAFGCKDAYPSITSLVHTVDLHDTGVVHNPLGGLVQFAPNWDDNFSMDKGFQEACSWVETLVRGLIRKDESRAAAYAQVAAASEEDGIVILDKFLPWQDYFQDHPELNAVIYPGRDSGTFNVQVPKGMIFPEAWLTTKPEGLVFIPAWRTMVVADSLETAKRFAAAAEPIAIE